MKRRGRPRKAILLTTEAEPIQVKEIPSSTLQEQESIPVISDSIENQHEQCLTSDKLEQSSETKNLT